MDKYSIGLQKIHMKYIIILSLLFIAATFRNDSNTELKPKFSHPQVIRYDHNTFYINGKENLYTAEVFTTSAAILING